MSLLLTSHQEREGDRERARDTKKYISIDSHPVK